MRKRIAIGAFGLIASSFLNAQGLNPGGQQKNDWEEINFEFNSSILSDGYPSLLRLADVLKAHPDYRVRVTGHTDYVGSNPYNEKLSLQRAEAVKAFLVKYGAGSGQIATAGDGKRTPEVDNRTREGRFMNRRVVLSVADAQGRVIKEGGISDVLPELVSLQELLKKQQECCDQILKRLDKLDEILAGIKGMQGDADRLKAELAELRNQHNQLRDQVAGLPKPLTGPETQAIAHKEALGALDEAQRRNRKFALLGLNIGPTYGPNRSGDFTFSGAGRFFSPFGGDGMRAVQAQGEYMYYPDRKEGQFDIGLVNRWHNLQAGAFGSFKFLDFSGFQHGGSLVQASFLGDYIFSRGRVGIFFTRGIKNFAVLNSVTLAPGAFQQTFARVVNQQGIDFMVGAWGRSSISGNIAYLKMRETTRDARPGANLKLTHPIGDHLAFTVEGSYLETLVGNGGGGRVVFGLEVGNFLRPKEFLTPRQPVPMDVPRIRYELATRRVGSSPPIADAGADQLNIPPGTVTLNGNGSRDPLGLALTYRWEQIGGPTVPIGNANAAVATFPAALGQTYTFRLTVRNTDNLSASDTTTVTAGSSSGTRIIQFTANPAQIQPGQSSTLNWVVDNATSATITPGPGNVDARTGSIAVTPAQTTTYTLSATGPSGTVTSTVTVQVGGATGPQILRFEASPASISPGGQTTLSWTTTGASQVSISGVGAVTPNGSTTVSPSQTTTYVLTAAGPDGRSVTASVTVTVAGSSGQLRVLSFTSNPVFSSAAGDPVTLSWQTEGANSVVIVANELPLQTLPANGTLVVRPVSNTNYTLTAYGNGGQTVSVVLHVFVR